MDTSCGCLWLKSQKELAASLLSNSGVLKLAFWDDFAWWMRIAKLDVLGTGERL